MAVIDIKNAAVSLRDGSAPVANTLEIKVGEGNITYSETVNREYILDRGRIDSVRNGDEAPMDVTFALMWEEIVASAGQTLKPEEALKRFAGAASWISSDPDTCQPFALDVELEVDAQCLTTKEREYITFPDFRYESLEHDVRAGSISVTGKCNALFPVIEHAVAAKLAAAFDAANTQFLSAVDAAVFPTGAAAGMSFWFRAEGVVGNQALVTKWEDTTAEEWAVHLVADKLRFDVGAVAPAGLGVNYEESSIDFVADTWYHIALTYAAGVVAIYVDGVLDASSTTTGTIPTTIADTAAEFRVGAFETAAAEEYFTGRIAELMLYSIAFAAGIATSLYNTGLGKTYANMSTAEKTSLVAAWDLGETGGTRVASIGGSNLTDNGTVLANSGIRVVK
jgi:hypothetical protein